MKKFKAFTLLEMIIVIIIIWIVSVSLAAYKKNTKNNYEATSREAVNIIYKEMNQFAKDFQRNKVWEDWSGNEHEIQYFYINFNNDIAESITWNNLTVWNLYIYTWEWTDMLTWYFDWITLITGQKYSAFQVLKWSDNYTFYTRNKNTWDITSILITNNWKIYTGNFQDINDFSIFNTENLMDWSIYNFLICWWHWKANPIWRISINAITKIATLDRCESERYAGINCDNFAKCE